MKLDLKELAAMGASKNVFLWFRVQYNEQLISATTTNIFSSYFLPMAQTIIIFIPKLMSYPHISTQTKTIHKIINSNSPLQLFRSYQWLHSFE